MDFAKPATLNDPSLSDDDLAFIKRIARKIHDSGLITPAILFLEMMKPLALIGSHAAIFFGPILSAFIRADGYYRAVEIFESPDHVEILICELENLEAGKDESKTVDSTDPEP